MDHVEAAAEGAGKLRAGQALRGSSELHAWGDSNLYLRRADDQLALSIEHRAAPSQTGLALGLRGPDDQLALHLLDSEPLASAAPVPTMAEKVERILADAIEPVPLGDLRRSCRMRAQTLGAVLAQLARDGRVTKSTAGYQLVAR